MIPPSGPQDEAVETLRTDCDPLRQRLAELEERLAQAAEMIAPLQQEAELLKLMNSELDAATLAQHIALALRRWCLCEAVGIRWRRGDDFPYLVTLGFAEDFILQESALCALDDSGQPRLDADGRPVLECMCGNVLRGRTDPSLFFFTPGGSFWTNSTTELLAGTSEQERQSETRNRCHAAGYESVALIPLRFAGTIYGLLQLNDRKRGRFTPRLIESLERMASVLAMRLAQDEARAEVQRLAAEAQAKADQLTDVLKAMPEWVVVYDRDGVVTVANAKALEYYGQPLVGLTFAGIAQRFNPRRPDGTPVKPEEMAFHRALDGEPVTNEEQIVDFSPRQGVHILVSAAPLYRGSEIDGAVVAWRDITELRHAQEELSTQREFLQAVLSQMHSGVLVVETDTHRVLISNRGMDAIWGRDMSGVVLDDYLGHVRASGPRGNYAGPEDWPVMRALQGQIVSNEAIRITREDGAVVHVAANSAPIRDQQGRLFASVMTLIDVTEAARAAEELQQYREHLEELVAARTAEVQERSRVLESVFNNSLSGLVLLDTDFNFIRVNRRYADACARSMDDFAGHNHFADYPSDELQAAFEAVVRTGRAWQASGRPFVFPDHPEWGITFWDLSVVPIMDVQGKVDMLLMSLQDVTQRKRAEALAQQRTAELVESEREYRELVENANSVIVRWDTAGTITFVNEYAERLFSYEPGELIGRPITTIVAPELSSGLSPEAMMQAILERPKDYELNENENVTKEGRVLWLSWSNRVIFDEGGQPTGIMAVGTDRTAQHQAERELREYQQKLRQLTRELALAEQRERQRLATGLHDDISQVLAFAKIKLAFAESQEQSPAIAQTQHEVRVLLDEAIQSTRRLTMELSPPVLAAKGISSAVEWALQRAGEQHGFSTSFTLQGQVRRLDQEVEITAFQAVKELLNNVAKHAQAAHVTVALAFGDEQLEIVVQDDGKGFDPALVQVSETGGFGLFNVRERLGYVGGSLVIDSAPGQGTRSTMVLPIK